jgi:hypothetical protein
MSRGTKAQLACMVAILWMATARSAHAVGPCPGMQILDATCDEGNPCTLDCRNPGSNCGAHPAVPDGMACDDLNACTTGNTCNAGLCGTANASGSVCRAAVGECDVAETCPGARAACPADAVAPSATVCRSAAANCDVAETCDGTTKLCPLDQFQPTGTSCRPATDECDIGDVCTGATPACPIDLKQSGGTPCTDEGNLCTTDQCGGTVTMGNGVCEHPAGNAGAVCRPSAGACDAAEMCTGSSTTCPTDAFASSTVVCRPSEGACDTAESCTGSGATCPADAKQPSGTECRASAGTCDVAEACDGRANA